MKKILQLLVIAATPLILVSMATTHDENADEKAVAAAVTDYLDALYEVKPELIERSVHKDLRKIGWGRRDDMKEYKGPMPMTYSQLHELSGKWNADGSEVTDESPREVVVLDVLDQTASAKLTAAWGIDYFHLAKFDGKWMIVNVMWQSHPIVAEAGHAR